jgi:hypothetical protein
MNDCFEMFDENKNQIIKAKKRDASTQKLLDKKFKKLKHKALYMNAEYEEVCDVFSYAQQEFISGMFIYCGRNKIKPPFADKQKEEKSEKKEFQEDIKELYREIVKATHPDKTKDLSDREVEERKQLYLDAVQGKKEGNFWSIFKAALELDMPIKELSFSYIEELEMSIHQLEEKIDRMKNDLMYKWYYSPESVQLHIFEQLTKDQEKYE